MPPCRPQMLHQLQTSSFLLSHSLSSFPYSLLRKQRRRERQEETYAVFKLTTSASRLPLPPLPHSHSLSFSLPPSSFQSHLSTDSLIPRAMTLVIYTYGREKGERGGKERGRVERHGRDTETVAQRDTNFRLNLTQGAKGC